MASQHQIGDIAAFAFPFVPKGWQACDGSLLKIADQEMLFKLIGTTYGGDGQVNFAVPDLRGRSPAGAGSSPVGNLALGQTVGAEQVNLTADQMPAHNHQIQASTAVGSSDVPDAYTGFASANGGIRAYGNTPWFSTIASTLKSVGGGQPVSIRDAFTAINWCIAVEGTFPSRQ